MADPTPSPAQARLLKLLSEPDTIIEVWFGFIVRWKGDSREEPLTVHRASVMAAKRFGWIEAVVPPASRRVWSDRQVFFRITDSGRQTCDSLPPQAFITPSQPRVGGKVTAIYRALAVRHPPPEWVFITEAPVAGHSQNRMDALAVNCYRTKQYVRIGYEIKVTRGDFFRELKKPNKTARTAAYCSGFFFVCPTGLIKPHEVPDPYGLVYVFANGTCRQKKRSTLPEVAATWEVVARLLRRAASL